MTDRDTDLLLAFFRVTTSISHVEHFLFSMIIYDCVGFLSKNHSHFPVPEFHFSFSLQSSPAGQTNREKAIAAIKEKVNCSHCFSSSLRDKAKNLYSILCFETTFFHTNTQRTFLLPIPC